MLSFTFTKAMHWGWIGACAEPILVPTFFDTPALEII